MRQAIRITTISLVSFFFLNHLLNPVHNAFVAMSGNIIRKQQAKQQETRFDPARNEHIIKILLKSSTTSSEQIRMLIQSLIEDSYNGAIEGRSVQKQFRKISATCNAI